MISYDNLWNVMKEKGVSQYALIKKHGISPAQITRLKRNESVSTHTIEMFCKILDCQVGDIMEYIKDERPILRHTGDDKIGGASFYAVEWDKLRRCGYKVAEYDACRDRVLF